MKVSIIAIGDELLIGQVTDTNSGSLARIMQPYGWEIDSVSVVHDDADAITKAIDEAFGRTDVILTTGGLGPTKDDITKKVLCKYFGGELRRDPEVTANIEHVFAARHITMNPLTADQALVPSSCRVIQNTLGTAPIMWFEKRVNQKDKILVSMPGVPFETIGMFEKEVFPQLLKRFGSDICIEHRTLLIADVTESKLAMQLEPWENTLPIGFHLAYLPKPGLIRLRIDGHGHDRHTLTKEIDRLHKELITMLGNNVIATSDLLPEESLINLLREKSLTVATAESCTGGTIAQRLTAIAGCSDVMMGGVVAYANNVKSGILGVDPDIIAQYGAVSQPVAEAMAIGVAKATGADCTMATTGIAGPSGGSKEKPVGTIWFGLYIKGEVISFMRHFPGDRSRVIDRAATTALTTLIRHLQV